jgi:ABC-type polysaccharide/polyol phosphate transport system ATPase subunit
MTAALSFEHVTKQFRGAREYRALRDDIAAAAGRAIGIKAPPRRSVTALDDLSFEVAEGEAFGLVGANGAGKTTALKIATRITYPTSGLVRVRGRVGALIEVGTGMHPELTGRENVALFGRILGLTARDVARRFDEIVDFAGVDRAIDQPVKQFSSGMQLRLGFAIAAHLEPDVLLVDEAISVGDAGFQYRCVRRMNQLVQDGGTLVLVSHDMNAIETLCTRAVLLDHGRIAADGPGREVVQQYLRLVDEQRLDVAGRAKPEVITGQEPEFEILEVTVHDPTGAGVDAVEAHEPMTVRVHYRARRRIERPSFTIGFGDGRLGAFSSASMLVDGESPEAIEGDGYVECTFEDLPLRPRSYEIWVGVRGEAQYGNLVHFSPHRLFDVVGELPPGRGALTWGMRTPVDIPYTWGSTNGATARR